VFQYYQELIPVPSNGETVPRNMSVFQFSCLLPFTNAYHMRCGTGDMCGLVFVQYDSFVVGMNMSSCEYLFIQTKTNVSLIQRSIRTSNLYFTYQDTTGLYVYEIESECKSCLNFHETPNSSCIACGGVLEEYEGSMPYSRSCVSANASTMNGPRLGEFFIESTTSMIQTTTLLQTSTSMILTTPIDSTPFATTQLSSVSLLTTTTSEILTTSSLAETTQELVTTTPEPTTSTIPETTQATSPEIPEIDWNEIERRIKRRSLPKTINTSEWGWRRWLLIGGVSGFVLLVFVCMFIVCCRCALGPPKRKYVSLDTLSKEELENMKEYERHMRYKKEVSRKERKRKSKHAR
jgi:hypothetical protein